jgi:pimeloyl-ACP methyl ester carboxylesterase
VMTQGLKTLPSASPRSRSSQWARRMLVSLGVSAGLVILASLAAGEALSQAARRVIGPAPPDLMAQTVSIRSTEGDMVAGWFSAADRRQGAVLLLHGLRADRRAMLERARLFKQLGYSVLLIDLPAHGESSGDKIGFGLREGQGVRAALDFLRQACPGEPVGVIGVSLGAASMVLSMASPAPDAVVLESMYPTIEEAVTDRLTRRLGVFGKAIAPLLLVQLPLRLAVNVDQLRPIAALPSLHAPVLIVSGARDEHTTLAETERIYAAAPGPKELWIVEGAAHVDLQVRAPRAYETRVAGFLSKYLGHHAAELAPSGSAPPSTPSVSATGPAS